MLLNGLDKGQINTVLFVILALIIIAAAMLYVLNQLGVE